MPKPQIPRILYYAKMTVKLIILSTMYSNELTPDFKLQYD